MLTNINSQDNERWLSDGDCKYCRRKSYCSTDCTAQKRRMQSILYQMVLDHMPPETKDVLNILDGANNEI